VPRILSLNSNISQRTTTEKTKMSNWSIFGVFYDKSRSIALGAIFTKSGAFSIFYLWILESRICTI